MCAALGLATAAACGPGLPSMEPLGSGPLAEREPAAGARRIRPPADAGAKVDAAPEPAPEVRDASVGADAAGDGGGDADDAARDGGDAEPVDADAPDAAPLDFAGEFSGEDTSTIRIEGMPDRTEHDPKARTRVEQSSPTSIELILINSANGDPLCTLKATVAGNEAVVNAGQMCFSEGEVLVGTIRSGKAQLTGDHLTLDLDVGLELNFGDESRDGEIDYHFEGDR